MLATFSCSVMLSGGRTVAVQPSTQIVLSIVAWVTAGLSAPGVQVGSGRESTPVPIAWQEPGGGCGCTTSLAAAEYASDPVRLGDGGVGVRRWCPCRRRCRRFAGWVAAVVATGTGGEVGCDAAEPVVLAPAPHPDAASVAANSAVAAMSRLRGRIVSQPPARAPVGERWTSRSTR